LSETDGRKRISTGRNLVLITILLILGAAIAYSQDAPGALVEKLRKLTAELRLKREQQSAERRLLESRKTLLLEEIQALKERENALSARRDALEEESVKLDESLASLSTEADSLRQSRIEAEKLVGSTAAAIENHIDSGLPLEARARADTVRDLLTGSEEPVEQLKLLWQLYVQEYRRAGEIELTSPALTGENKTDHTGEVPPGPEEVVEQVPGGAPTPAIKLEDGILLPGRILRIGTVGAVFLSDDGNTAAMLLKTPKGFVWRRVATHSQLAQIRSAFKIAAGRRAPRLVNMPLQFNAGGKPSKPGGEGGGK
jgi:cell division protein FtsB